MSIRPEALEVLSYGDPELEDLVRSTRKATA